MTPITPKGRAPLSLADYTIYGLLLLSSLLCLYPLLYVVNISLADIVQVMSGGLILYPKNPSFEAYRQVFHHPAILNAYGNTIYITVLGTALDLMVTSLAAYALSKKYLPYRTGLTIFVLITMLFNGGIIPNYIAIRSYGLLNKLAVLYIPVMASAFYIFVMRNFFAQIPDSLEESAKIDGAGDGLIFFRLILPLSKPVLASIALFCAVRNWNTFFAAVIYISDSSKYTLQVIVRQLYTNPADLADTGMSDSLILPTETLKSATVVVAVAPILMVYPFLQKYFVKGMMVGSVKG